MKKAMLLLMAALITSTATQAAPPAPSKVATQPPVAQPPVSALQLPPPEAMIIMIRSTLVALSHANTTNNYTVLSALGSPGFRKANTPAKLQTGFAAFRASNIDLNQVVFVTPILTGPPTIENGRLRLVGIFPTEPLRVDFNLQFEPSEGTWKMAGLAVNLVAAQTPLQQQPYQPRPESPVDAER